MTVRQEIQALLTYVNEANKFVSPYGTYSGDVVLKAYTTAIRALQLSMECVVARDHAFDHISEAKAKCDKAVNGCEAMKTAITSLETQVTQAIDKYAELDRKWQALKIKYDEMSEASKSSYQLVDDLATRNDQLIRDNDRLVTLCRKAGIITIANSEG